MSRAILPLVDRALNGQLKARLDADRAAGCSYDDIARALHSENVVTVTGETIRKWCIELGITTQGAAS